VETSRLAVDLAPHNPRELRLDNPIIAASGCFGYGQEYASIIDVQRLGAFVSKGITPRPRSGNPMPRIVETPSGMLNAIGLQNPGIHGFIKKYPPMWTNWRVPAIVNISAESVEDYAMMASLLDEVPGVAAIEVNISCPNIAAGGYCFGWDPDMSADVTRAVRRSTTLPVMVKLSPGATDIVAIAQAVEEAGADSANVTGGLSGPAVKPIALRMVYQVAAAVRVPVVGMGGIAGLADALEFFMAGASAIQVGTAIFVQPTMLIRLIDDLDEWLVKEGISSIGEIVGVAHPRRAGQHERDLAPETAVAAG
jgi:dihydroorotate dehydrogenase (NAD+) catalytic subunit